MKKIKFLLMAFVAMMLTAAFTGCSKDDNNDNNSGKLNNFTRYMQTVEKTVKDAKTASGNKKALLLVAFGSTWENAHQTFKGIVDDYKADQAFKDYDVFFSFTSAICINKSREGEHYASQDFYAPNFWLEAIGREKYEEVRVQSLHLIPGEEFLRLRDTYIKDFKNNIYADLDPKYLDDVKVFIGGPLMAEEEDVTAVAKALNDNFKDYVKGDNVMCFLGHGNPEGYNYGNGNVRYQQLEQALQHNWSENYYVATVDMEDNLLDDLYERMVNRGVKDGCTITLHALMCIAGDHAHNDMSGIENKNDSWREFFKSKGYVCNYDGNDANKANNCILKGMGDYANIRNIWKEHTKNATEMFAEEEEEE